MPSTEDVVGCRPATRTERLRAIWAVVLGPHLSRLMQANLRRLLELFERWSDETGSHARQETLAARLGISERTLRSWILVARQEQLLDYADRYPIGGGRQRVTWLNWERILAGPPRVVRTQLLMPFISGDEDDRTGRIFRSPPEEIAGRSTKDLGTQGKSPPKPPELEAAIETAPEPATEPNDARQDEGRPIEPGVQEREWGETRELLRARGIATARRLTDRLQARGLEPWTVCAVLAFWDAHRRYWGPGALWARLQELEPGRVPESDWRLRWDEVLAIWPRPIGKPTRPGARSLQTAAGERSAPRAAVESVQAADVREDKRRKAQEWARTEARVERDFGSWFDALTTVERLRLVDELLGGVDAQRWRSPQTSAATRRSLRTLLLQAIEQRAMAQEVRA